MNPLPFGLPSNFLEEYWQKKPLLLRQAFPDFTPELDVDDVAGLACDELAESRLISGSYPTHDWSLSYGPFAEQDLTSLPGNSWTLLVQDVEKHYPPLQSLLNSFSFLPSWRIDDLMISIAAPGGSVGPHVDQYDVFLLQASGRRNWQIASAFDPRLLPDCELNVLKSFEAEQEWVLEPGDMLYLPPGIAHHGVAIEPGMTWSIGTRAPSSADLLQALGEWLAANANEGERYRDERLDAESLAGEVDMTALQGFRQLLGRAISDESDFQAFIGSFLSRYRLAHEPAPPEEQCDSSGLSDALRSGGQLRHNPWTRLLWLEEKEGADLFAAGERFRCSKVTALSLCTNPVPLDLKPGSNPEALNLACELVNKGHLYLA